MPCDLQMFPHVPQLYESVLRSPVLPLQKGLAGGASARASLEAPASPPALALPPVPVMPPAVPALPSLSAAVPLPLEPPVPPADTAASSPKMACEDEVAEH